MTKLYYGHGLTEASHHFQTEPEAVKERLTDTSLTKMSFSLSFFPLNSQWKPMLQARLPHLLQLLLRSPVLPESVQLQTLCVVTLLGLLQVTTLNLQSLHCLHCPHHLLLCLGNTQKYTRCI